MTKTARNDHAALLDASALRDHAQHCVQAMRRIGSEVPVMNERSRGAESLFAILANLAANVHEILMVLEANSNVQEVTMGFDVGQDRDFMEPEKRKYMFESYVEATDRTGEIFSWLLDFSKTSAGWEVHRMVDRQTKNGGHAVVSFKDVVFDEIHDVENGISMLIEEFAESARNFNAVRTRIDVRTS